MMEELKAEADRVRNSIKAEMEAREVEELIAGQYIIRWTSVLSNRFDSTAFKRVCPELYKAYTKQTASRRFTISVYKSGHLNISELSRVCDLSRTTIYKYISLLEA